MAFFIRRHISFCQKAFKQLKALENITVFPSNITMPSHCFYERCHFKTSAISDTQTHHEDLSIKQIENLDDFYDIKYDNYKHLTTNVEEEEMLRLIIQEYESITKKKGKFPPFTEAKMIYLIRCNNQKSRFITYRNLRNKAYIENLIKEKKSKRKERHLEKIDSIFNLNSKILYGRNNNSIFHHNMTNKVFNSFYGYNVAHTVLYGQKIVIDLDYDQDMRENEIWKVSSEIFNSYLENYKSRHPFNLFICNTKQDSPTLSRLRKQLPQIDSPQSFVTLTDKSYLECFPKEKLVYLSPDAEDVLQEFDHDAVYIIGGVADIRKEERPLSLEKAKREQVKTFRFDVTLNDSKVKTPFKLDMAHVINHLRRLKHKEQVMPAQVKRYY